MQLFPANPRLPPELEQIVFEFAALSHPTTIPKFMQVASRIKIWYVAASIPSPHVPNTGFCYLQGGTSFVSNRSRLHASGATNFAFSRDSWLPRLSSQRSNPLDRDETPSVSSTVRQTSFPR
jgi:hypothetical protein